MNQESQTQANMKFMVTSKNLKRSIFQFKWSQEAKILSRLGECHFVLLIHSTDRMISAHVNEDNQFYSVY